MPACQSQDDGGKYDGLVQHGEEHDPVANHHLLVVVVVQQQQFFFLGGGGRENYMEEKGLKCMIYGVKEGERMVDHKN